METLPVPEAALREAVLNAVIHKDYASGTPIQISVYANKLMLWNPGQLPPRWTVAKLKGKHSSQPFNPDIANAFFRAGHIEAWGRGIERIMEACREAGFPEPALEHEATGLWINFKFPTWVVEGAQDKTREKTREKILRLLRENSNLSTDELAVAAGITRKGVEWHISRMKKEGVLKRVGPDHGGHWEVLK